MDTLTPAARSRLMSRVTGDKLKPEEALAAELRRRRRRVERNAADLPGRPDIVLRRARVAVFVDGCFWHGCELHYREPKTRRAFWRAKVGTNRRRDEEQTRELRATGWTVVRAWECAGAGRAADAVLRAAGARTRGDLVTVSSQSEVTLFPEDNSSIWLVAWGPKTCKRIGRTVDARRSCAPRGPR